LLRDEGVALGRLDGRYLGDEADDMPPRGPEDDASRAISVSSAYSALMNQYLSSPISAYEMDRPYHGLR
jgi:hypothetical protein